MVKSYKKVTHFSLFTSSSPIQLTSGSIILFYLRMNNYP